MNRPKVTVDEDEPKRDAKGASDASRDAVADTASLQQKPGARPLEAAEAWLHKTFPGHENAVLCGFLGLIVAILLFAIGFWATLLVARRSSHSSVASWVRRMTEDSWKNLDEQGVDVWIQRRRTQQRPRMLLLMDRRA